MTMIDGCVVNDHNIVRGVPALDGLCLIDRVPPSVHQSVVDDQHVANASGVDSITTAGITAIDVLDEVAADGYVIESRGGTEYSRAVFGAEGDANRHILDV